MPEFDKNWDHYRIYVIETLTLLNTEVKAIRTDINDLKSQVQVLNWKSGLWGAVAGAIPVLVVLIVWIIQKLVSAP